MHRPLVFLLILSACTASEDNESPAVGAPGLAARALRAATPVECPDGGVIVEVGFDGNGNGELDASEVLNSSPVCNGASGGGCSVDVSATPRIICDDGTSVELPTGPSGSGIGEVALTVVEPEGTANAELETLPGGDRRLRLTLPLPNPPTSGPRIQAVSWVHNGVVDDNEFSERGIVFGFDQFVDSSTLGIGDSTDLVVELFALSSVNGGWTRLATNLNAAEVDQLDPDGRIVDFVRLDSTPQLISALSVRPTSFLAAPAVVRVVLRGDFVLDADAEAADFEFIGGELPSGNGTAGGTFESWFRLENL